MILGLSYNKNVGDTRDTPVAPVINHFLEKGNNVEIHDPYIKEWEGRSIYTDLNKLIASNYDMIVVCTAHDDYAKDKKMRQFFEACKGSLLVVDTVGVLRDSVIRQLENNVKVKVIGRGDI